jgi:hypothetical protein
MNVSTLSRRVAARYALLVNRTTRGTKGLKQVVGIPVKGQHHTGYTNPPAKAGQNQTGKPTYRPITCEILEADGTEYGGQKLRWRTTFDDTGEVIEAELSPKKCWINGQPAPNDGMDYSMQDECLCNVLRHVFGDEFTGYEHNYWYDNGRAYEPTDEEAAQEYEAHR